MKQKEDLNVGIIGFGTSGKVFHAPIISAVDGFRLAAVKSSSPEAEVYVSQHYPGCNFVDDPVIIFDDPEIDLVVISTVNTLHYPLARQALLAGKHVVVEKPFTITSSEADHLIQLAEKHKRVLTVYQNRRWDSDFQTLQKVVRSGVLGNIVEAEFHFDRFRNYFKNAWKEEDKPGAGIWYDLGAHLVDQALVLFGIPEEVFADISIQREGGKSADNFDVKLYYENLRVTLKAGMLVKEQGPRYILHGDRGAFVKYGMDVQEEDLKKGKSPAGSDDWGMEPENIWGTLNTEKERKKVQSERGDYRGFYQNLYDVINKNTYPEVKPQQAKNTVRIIELALQSSQERRVLKTDI